MDGSDYPQDDRPGTPSSKVPSLIHDYRAQREAWREQARNLARMREEVLAAADTEAKDIVSTARADIRRILLKARRDLLVLAAQVRAAGRLGEIEGNAPDTERWLPTDDLGQAHTALTSARHEVRRVLDESRPELEGLVAEGEALRAALRPQQAATLAAVEPLRSIPSPVQAPTFEQFSDAPVDFDFASIGGSSEAAGDLTVRHPRPTLRASLAVAATVGAVAVMGLWFYRGDAGTTKQPAGSRNGTTPGGTAASSGAAANRVSGAVAARAGGLSLNVATRRNTWMRVTVDGAVAAERLFKAGETQTVNASRDVIIRAGDAGAVMVSVNGAQAAALGREGEVLTRKYGAPAPPAPAAAKPATATTTQPPVAQAPRPVQNPPAQSAAATPVPSSRAPEPVTPPPSPITVIADQSVPTPIAASRATPPAVERPAAAAPRASAPTLQESLTSSAVRFLDAYYRQDRATMASISPQINVDDDRGDKERLPRGLAGVQRSLDDVNVQVVNQTEAMLTARMTERMENAGSGQGAMAVSFVSLMWSQRSGSWQMYNARIVSAASLVRATQR